MITVLLTGNIQKETYHKILNITCSLPSEMKRQKSVPEDLKKAEADRGSPTEADISRPFEEEVCPFFIPLYQG